MSTLGSNQLQPKLGDAYLKLQLDLTTVSALLLDHIQEVLVIPVEQITFMPNMPDCVLGLINRRNKVLWLVDFPQMMGLESLERDVRQYHIAIARLENMLLGLAVEQVRGVIRLTAAEIESPQDDDAPNLKPYLKGRVLEQGESLMVLDAKAIINAPI
ncbi:MAG: chemotaxis protein CheW [Xenococcaceae cyanobacterium MO_188.B29]|nr:chemotaxis protein CheW [Xenococcaceae cyanobacterium MO_188.B29]